MKKDSIIKLTALGGVPLLMVLGNSMLIPVFPQMKSALGISQFQVGLIITLFSIPAGLSIPILGFLSDKISRKLIIVPSLLIYGIGGLVSGIAPIFFQSNAYTVLLAGRIIQGVGAAGTGPIAMALVSDIFTSNERSQAQGAIESANGLGKVVSPILGSLIALITWYTLFFVYSFLAIPVALGVWFLVKEPKSEKESSSFKQYIAGIGNIFAKTGKSLIGSYLAASVVLFTLFGILAYLSDVLEVEYGLNGVIKGFALAGPVLAMSTTSFISGRVLKNNANLMKLFIVGGLAILTFSLIVLSIFKANIIFFIAILIMGIGTGSVLPAVNTVVTSAAPLEERGGVTALYGTVRFFGVAAGPPTYSKLLEISKPVMFWGASGIALLAFGLSFLLITKKELAQPADNSGDSKTGKQEAGEQQSSIEQESDQNPDQTRGSKPLDNQKQDSIPRRTSSLTFRKVWKPALGVAGSLLILFPFIKRKQR
ncbi:MFS transporter [Metallumcola ferriviriculae]|uniref:MFS transporter n=1 Tax=Metallumcola ferriviriculae TaxID=3039180 RepID=A0AAU0UK10_9FIRM|nr:MFS transporter [Desulfitibacteraceae bacterium MK1]